MGCRKDDEKVRDAVLNHVEALEVHGAPFRAFTFLTTSDKKAIDADEFAREFGPENADSGTSVTVGEVSMMGTRANALVLVDKPGHDTEQRTYILVKESDGKWRVEMKLAERKAILEIVDRAGTLAAAGDVEAANELVEQVSEKPFRGSRPERVDEAIESVQASLDDRRRVEEIREKIVVAKSLERESLEAAISELEPLVKPEETPFLEDLDELRATLKKQIKAHELEQIVVKRTKVRRVNRDGQLVREGIVWVTNGLDRSISTLVLTLSFTIADEPDSYGQASYVVMRDGNHKAGERREFVFRIDAEPEGWKGRQFEAVAADFAYPGDDR